MENKNMIQDELRGLNSELLSKSQENIYSVPQDYFEGLASSILSKIKSEDSISASDEITQLSPLLKDISKQNPYSVPDHYFQSNIELLPAFTSDKEESLILSFIEKEMPYEIPSGYFANLSEQVLETINNRSARIVPMKKRKWMQLAAAAIITGFVAVSGIFYFNKGNTIQAVKDPVAAVKKASTQELNDFLKSTDVSLSGNNNQVTAKNISKTESKKLFQDISDSELQKFLDQAPAYDENLLN